MIAIRHDLKRATIGRGLTLDEAVAVGNELITDETVLNYEILKDGGGPSVN